MAKGLGVALFSLVIVGASLQPAVCQAQACGTWVYGKRQPHRERRRLWRRNHHHLRRRKCRSVGKPDDGPWHSAPAAAGSIAWAAAGSLPLGPSNGIFVSDDGLS